MYPYLVYLILNLTYLIYASTEYEEERDHDTYLKVVSLSGATLPFWCYQVFQEALDIRHAKKLNDYIKQWANAFDLIHLTLTPVMFACNAV